MQFKVTGQIRNGLWDKEKEEWVLARMTPRFFPSYYSAKYFAEENLEIGAIWTLNEEGARNRYSVTETFNMKWPEGARGK